jgi:rhodanese-related sulfurtransferase
MDALIREGAAGSPLDATPATDSRPTMPEAGPEDAFASLDATNSSPDVESPTDGQPVVQDGGPTDTLTSTDADRVEASESAEDAIEDSTGLPPPVLHEMSPQQLEAALASKDFLLIDVHTPNAGSIPGTDARIAYTDIAGLVAFIGPNLDTAVVLTCLEGAMSKQAGDELVALGYRNISELTGGMTAWKSAGYPLIYLDSGT